MSISYKHATLLFFLFYLLPIAVMGFFVRQRIQQQQVTLQLFLQNQIDIDRKILDQRATLRGIQPRVRSVLLNGGTTVEQKDVLNFVRGERDKMDKFWKQYESSYAAGERPVLQGVLRETQEMNLIDEEARVVSDIQIATDAYVAAVLAYPPLSGAAGFTTGDHARFLDSLDDKREVAYTHLNELADIRYIFGQRMVFLASGENAAAQGTFTAVFISLFLIVLVVSLLEYFFINRPLGDIILFLQDMREGKRGQRLYFSSPVREIKQSEHIINAFVSKAEAHEEEEQGRIPDVRKVTPRG